MTGSTTLRHRKPLLIGLLLAVGLVAGGLGLRSCATADERRAEVHGVRLHAACTECGWHGATELSNRPAECESCRKPGVWPAEQCRACGEVQPIDQDDSKIHLARVVACRKCGEEALEMIPLEEPAP